MDVYGDLLIFLNNIQGFLNMSQPTLAQYIQFEQTYFLSEEHINLRSIEIFRWKFCSGIMVDGQLADQHASGMNAEVIGKIAQEITIVFDLSLNLIVFQIPLNPAGLFLLLVIRILCPVHEEWLCFEMLYTIREGTHVPVRIV